MDLWLEVWSLLVGVGLKNSVVDCLLWVWVGGCVVVKKRRVVANLLNKAYIGWGLVALWDELLEVLDSSP